MTRLLLALLLAALGAAPLRADDAPAPVTDPAQVEAHFRQVAARPAFQESDEPTLNSRFSEWISDWFKHFGSQFGDFKYASRMPAFESMLMSLLVTFCIMVLLYVMVRLTRRRAQLEIEPAPGAPSPRSPRAPESYDREIVLATESGDWHAAWLAAWRQFLARLEHRRLVEADRTRTNREYLAQLRGQSLPAPALALLHGMVDAYDHFIYGRVPIAEPDWRHFHRQLDEAVLLLHLDPRRFPEPPTGAAA